MFPFDLFPALSRLARFYSVPVAQLLPRSDDDGELEALDGRDDSNVTIDLTRLDTVSGPESLMLSRYLTMIQMQRQDFNGRMLTIRRDDLRAIACILDATVETAASRLADLGLRLGA